MGRRFQTGDVITFPVPAVLNGTDGGPRTILVVGKCTSAYQALVYTRSTGAHGWWYELDTAGGLHANYGTGTTLRNVGTVGSGAAEIWTARKDNGGSVNPFGRRFSGASFATDGGDVNAGATLVDGTAIDTTYAIAFGRWGNTGTDWSTDLELYAVYVWNSLVDGATLAALTKTHAGILAGTPDYWAKFEGTGTPTDSAGGTPTVTGTTTVADPSGFFASNPTMAATFTGFSATMAAKATTYATMAGSFTGFSATATGRTTYRATMAATFTGFAGTMAAKATTYAVMAATFPGFSATMLVPAAGTTYGVMAGLFPGFSATMTAKATTYATMAATFPGFAGTMAARATTYATMAATFTGFSATMTVPTEGATYGTMVATFAGFRARMRVRTGQRVVMRPGAPRRPHLSAGPSRARGLQIGL